jgi:uncharacterized protein with ParB-like and HNH nuclease domain
MSEKTPNEIELRSIGELLEMNFFIPSYQRGYRWDKQQVEDLLDDIYDFVFKNKGSKIYCLQPVIVRKCGKEDIEKCNLDSKFDNNEWYEVIDGQQRLTTISIILYYLIKHHLKGTPLKEEYGKNEFILEYETRPNTRLFLQNIEREKSKESIDFYFIYQAYENISAWFEKYKLEQRTVRDNILKTLVLKTKNLEQKGTVQVIWYEIKDETDKQSIDTFRRINMGKIPLTNAELIKALFLQKRKSEEEDKAAELNDKATEFNNKVTELNDKVTELRKIEIANEWDKMEYHLQNEDFWRFLNKGKNEIPARIEFLLILIFGLKRQEEEKKGNDQKFDKRFGTDEHKIFRYFNSLFPDNITYKTIEKEWDTIKNYFYAFDEWFNKPVWYHYIGFLIYCEISVIDIYNIYRTLKKKDEFKEALIKEIKDNIIIEYEKDKDDNFLINLSYNDSKEKIRQFLLLFNIEFIVQQYNEMMKNKDNEDDVFIFKFPFKIFKDEDWDIEHIDSYTKNPIKKKETQKEWLDMAEEDLGDKFSQELKDKITHFRKEDKNDISVFDSIKREIIKLAEEDDNDEVTKNSMGNLTLLDAGTNRSYGYSLFPTKRRIIIKKDMEGKFIPICTKNVFLKYFDKKGITHSKWGSGDIKFYQNYIGKVLKDFLILKEKK